MSASDVLRRFIKRGLTTHESRRALDEFLLSPCYNYFSKTLRGLDVLRYADFLDKALNWIPTTEILWTTCLNALRRVCGERATLPSTHVLSRGTMKRVGSASKTNCNDDGCWEAKYKRNAVRVRSLRISPASDQVVKMFCHEVVIWKRLNHPNITSVLGVTMDPYQVVFSGVSDKNVTQYAPGEGVDRGSLILDITEGLRYLHSRKVIHGRLRGAAVLVDSQGRVMLTDFGSCSVVWCDEDTAPIVRWCAPEVLGRENISGTRPTYASDVFSFGMVILEVLSGKVPFDGVSDDEVVKRVRSGGRPHRPQGSINLGLSDALWDVIQECWDGSPELRPRMIDVLDYTGKIRQVSSIECDETSTLCESERNGKCEPVETFSNFRVGSFKWQTAPVIHT